MKRIFVFMLLCLVGFSVPLSVQAERASYKDVSIKASSYVEKSEQSINVRICFEGVKVSSTNLYRNCARLKTSVSKKASSFNQQWTHIIFETRDTQLDFTSNSKDNNGNYKFWLREQSSQDTPPGFSSFIRKFDKPRQIMIGAMCSKFADDNWLKENVRKSLKTTNVSQGVASQIKWDRAFKSWNNVATRCARLAARRVGSALTMQAAPKPEKFSACGLNSGRPSRW